MTISRNVQDVLEELGFDPGFAEDLQEALYDQLTQYTKGELLSDIRTACPMQSMESHGKAYAYGRKKTA